MIVWTQTHVPSAPTAASRHRNDSQLSFMRRFSFRFMADSTNSAHFEDIVQWAYSTLPQEIRDLPDFPGIQVADEPPEEVFRETAKRRNWPAGTEMLGLYSGIYRTEPQHFSTRIAPDLIFVFRGPILRCSRGNLRAEVKRVVWHEVAHWLGNDEEAVKQLGLSTSDSFEESTSARPDCLASGDAEHPSSESIEDVSSLANRPRCIHCYSADLSVRKIARPLSYSFDPATVDATIFRCRSCGSEWQDDDED